MSGWIKLHRSVKDHWIFKNESYLKAWISILIEVNHKDNVVLIDTDLVNCNRGQSLHSLSKWAAIFGKGWSVQKVRTFFELLKKDSMIQTEGLRKTTRLTVCKYDSYQSEQQTTNRQLTDSQQTDNTQITTNKNEENENNEKNEEEKINRAIALERDFDIFWNKYDKKRDAKKCKDLFMKLSDMKRHFALEAVSSYVQSTPEEKYRKNPLTWLRGECWNDELKKDVKPMNQVVQKTGFYEDFF